MEEALKLILKAKKAVAGFIAKRTPEQMLFGTITISVLILGLIFGSLVFSALDVPEELPVFAQEELSQPQPALPEAYVLYLGSFETMDAFLETEGRVRALGYGFEFYFEDGEQVAFSAIGTDPAQLEDIRLALEDQGLAPRIEKITWEGEEVEWLHFFQALWGVPFQLEESFMELFTESSLDVGGYYLSFSVGSVYPGSAQHQQMLLEVYSWLRGS